MLETPETNRINRRNAAIVSSVVAALFLALAWIHPVWLLGLPIAGFVYWWWRRRTVRRLAVIAEPFPPEIEADLQQYVAYFRALDESGKERFRNLVKVFLDEVTITGIRTDVDTTTRSLVAASAVIPIFGFDDWEYSGLGEVLIYPNRFGDDFSTEGEQHVQRHTLGMVGVGHLSGVMILAKPDLLAGFKNATDKRNVGIHEFAHLVDKADGTINGLPPGVDLETAKPWIEWIGREIRNRPTSRHHIDDYAYTNEAEYFAVLSEYFFESPATLQQKAPRIYDMMRSMYHQNTKRFLAGVRRRPRRVGRNSPCPCGSGEKYKNCCRKRR